VLGDLRRGFLDADLAGPKSIFSLKAGLRASGNGSDLDDGADADVDLSKSA
jgi:hypothetical protein